jgi:UDP-N-acetylmuramoyl-tripeptide--D-alanyl-D-alanine ligase
VLAGDTDGSGAAVLAALGRLARAVVDRLPGLVVVGITGSSGKTSTKDLTAALLRPLGLTIAPPGSFNNELGHPWTVLRADRGTRHLVLELSARGPGHIAALCRAAPPRIGVVVNVGSAHLGEFGSRDAIAEAKAELVEALPPAHRGGVAVLNADDAAVAAMAIRTAARTVLVGRAEAAHVRAVDVRLGAAGRAAFRLVTPYGEAPVRLAVQGEHQVGNALAAAAVALELGATVPAIADGLASAAPVSRWRMEVTDRADGVTVINDAYNANPESVLAALRTLATMAGGGRRSWAVLGPLGELGEAADSALDELGRRAVRLGIDRLVVVGEQARALYDGARRERPAGEESVLVPDVEAATALLRAELRSGDVVLVKASRAFGLERIAAALLPDRPAGEAGAP